MPELLRESEGADVELTSMMAENHGPLVDEQAITPFSRCGESKPDGACDGTCQTGGVETQPPTDSPLPEEGERGLTKEAKRTRRLRLGPLEREVRHARKLEPTRVHTTPNFGGEGTGAENQVSVPKGKELELLREQEGERVELTR